MVDLFVRSWVEIPSSYCIAYFFGRRPLREVVSWNNSYYYFCVVSVWSTSSWGRELKWNVLPLTVIVLIRRPLREVVSWNAITQYFFNNLLKSTSSWGRELKSSTIILIALRISSTSSWGRELKYLMNTGTEFLCRVDLFVRSWVEIRNGSESGGAAACRPLREVVSWNSEKQKWSRGKSGRPLREVVSWNA